MKVNLCHKNDKSKTLVEAIHSMANIERVIENEMTLEKIQVFMKTMKPSELVAIMNSAFSLIAMEKVEKDDEERKMKDTIEKRDATGVSVPRIEEKTDLKVEPVVKVEEMSSESVHNMFIRIIKQQKEKEEKKDIWENSPYKDLVKLQSNNVGNVGEELINEICKSSGIEADCNGAKTKQIGGGEGDGKIMGIPVEIKTAHQGSSSPSFQHELGEVPWKGAKYMIFVDISPECIYLTIFKNFGEATYKNKEKLPCFPTKTITWRKEKGAFKLDTSVKINELSIENGHAIKITQSTTNDSIASFIRKIIV
jgi:hypothetical protein